MALIPKGLLKRLDALFNPIASPLIAAGVQPNAITTVGTLILVGGGVAFGFGYPRVGGALLLLSGAFDVIDGKVARGGGLMSAFGAFYDSTLDRVGESVLFGGIAVFFLTGGARPDLAVLAVSITILALASGLVVSYARARAEGLRLECRVGIAQRAERILGLGIPTLFFGAGPDGFLLLILTSLLAVAAVITIGQRIRHVYVLTRADARRSTAGPEHGSSLAGSLREGRGGD